MEPSSVEDGNPIWPRARKAVWQSLQWSRPQLRTETRRNTRNRRRKRDASMEPSSVEDGNCEIVNRFGPASSCFNGAVLS